jgi:transketolase
MVFTAAAKPAAPPLAPPEPSAIPPGGEMAGGTRVNTARLLAAALRDVATAVARQAQLPAPSTGLTMPLAVLFSRTLKFDAADAGWPDRDRFVLSCAAATPLLYALLHLSGYPGMEQQTLDHCGEIDAVATRTATFGRHPAIEATAAPGGQTVAMAIGMAMAERSLAARFGKSLVDHRIWAVADAAELSHGVTQEAAGLAGLLRLDRLALIADASAPDAEDARARFAALGWAVKSAAADRPDDIESALSFALRSRKPTLLWCATRADAVPALGRVTPNAMEAWRRVGARGSVGRRAWLKRIARHPLRAEFERVTAGKLSDTVHETLAALRQQLKAGPSAASPAEIGQQLIDRLIASVPELLLGQTEPARGAGKPAGGPAGPCPGRITTYVNRPHALIACTSGLAVHSGALPITTSALIDVIEQLPALRGAALHQRRSVHVAFDPGFNAAGAPNFAAEALPWLRAIPNLQVFRPCCAVETVECFELALRRTDGPSLLVLSRTVTPKLRTDPGENRCARGGYVLAEAEGPRRATLIATGPGLVAALDARKLLAAEGIAAAVVSLPCWSLFAAQDEAFRRVVLGTVPRFAVEAAGRAGWDRWLNETGGFIGCDELMVDGPGEAVRQRYGLVPELVAQTVRRRVG